MACPFDARSVSFNDTARFGHAMACPYNSMRVLANMKHFQTPIFGLGGGLALGLLFGCAGAATNGGAVSSAPNASTRAAQSATQENPKRAAILYRTDDVPQGVTGAYGLTVPRGFSVTQLTDGLTQPRRMAIAPGGTPNNYDVFVAESAANRVRVLRVKDGKLASNYIFTNKVDQPYGLAFHPAGWLYVGNTDSVVRFPYKSGATSTKAAPQKIATLTEGGYNQHWTRNLLFSRDAKKLYVTVGSSCNTCEESDAQRAAVSVMNRRWQRASRFFASGLRNPVGLAFQPGTDDLWTVVNERDNMGDDVPPDYLTQLERRRVLRLALRLHRHRPQDFSRPNLRR